MLCRGDPVGGGATSGAPHLRFQEGRHITTPTTCQTGWQAPPPLPPPPPSPPAPPAPAPPSTRRTQSSHRLGDRVTPQLNLVPVRIPEFELLPIALCPPRRTDGFLHVDACGLQLRMQVLHVRRAKHQTIMIHVGRHP